MCWFCAYKPNSVLQIVIYLGLLLLISSSDSSALSTDTILHSRKDLAVSLLCYHKLLPTEIGSLAFRHWRHCSHLVSCLRRALPATLPVLPTRGGCKTEILSLRRIIPRSSRDTQFCNCLWQAKLANVRTFLPDLRRSNYPTQNQNYYKI